MHTLINWSVSWKRCTTVKTHRSIYKLTINWDSTDRRAHTTMSVSVRERKRLKLQTSSKQSQLFQLVHTATKCIFFQLSHLYSLWEQYLHCNSCTKSLLLVDIGCWWWRLWCTWYLKPNYFLWKRKQNAHKSL